MVPPWLGCAPGSSSGCVHAFLRGSVEAVLQVSKANSSGLSPSPAWFHETTFCKEKQVFRKA